MKDPQLSPDEFLPDRILAREPLFQVGDLALHAQATVEEASATFLSRDPLRISMPCKAADLSRFNRLTLTVRNRSEGPLLVGLNLVHGSEVSPSGHDPVSFTGGREILAPGWWEDLMFPVESYGFYGNPCGWTDVRSIELTFAREKGRSEPREINLAMRAIDGEFRELPPGPRLTGKGLVGRLRPNSLETCGPSGEEGVDGCLCEQLGTRFTSLDPYTLENSAILIPPPHPYPREDAEAILAGRIMGQRLPDPIPWDFNPLGCHEWTHFLNRHHFLRELVVVFARTGDLRYAEALDRLISSWIIANPVPLASNGGAGPAWETLSTAWRLREWLWVAGIVWPSGAFRNKTKILMLRSIWEHARSLMDYRGPPGNWIMVESAALALAGLCFPGFREAPLWVDEALSRLKTACDKQFLADGVHSEISPLYHAICLHALLEVKEAALAASVPFPDAVNGALDRATEYLPALCRPDFTWPSLNDSGGASGDFTALLRKACELLQRSDLLWIGTRGRAGTPCAERSHVFPEAGVVTMRAGQGRHSNFLVFRAGSPGTGHTHEDVLSLDLTALGIPRLVDPGITTYAPESLTHWYRSDAAHNLLLIDESERNDLHGDSRKKALPADNRLIFQRQNMIEVAVGVSRRPGTRCGTSHLLTRTVVFVNGEYWIVADTASGPPDGELSTCWQFFPGRVEKELETNTLRCVDARGPRFEVAVLPGPVQLAIEANTGSLTPPCGWVSINGADFPAPHFRCHWKTTLPATVMWLLLPYEGSPVSGVQSTRIDREDGAICLDLSFPSGCRDTIIFRQPTTDQPRQKQITHCSIEFSRRYREDLLDHTLLAQMEVVIPERTNRTGRTKQSFPTLKPAPGT